MAAERRRALIQEVKRVALALEGVPSLTIGTVSGGPHA
jgi:hypothetical protein